MNDNLKNHREEKLNKNKNLIAKTIEKILEVDGVLSNNNVSKVSYLVADEKLGERGITPSAISKNEIYKIMIKRAKLKQKNDVKVNNNSATSGDLRMQIFELQIEKEMIQRENKLLKEVLKKHGGGIHLSDIKKEASIEEGRLIKESAKGLINRLLELELAEYNLSSNELIVAQLNDVLLNSIGYRLIMGEEK